ncbi:MAG TPA: SDR family oxidoreductase [Fimbriimonadaceae bacterium]|nr:SDR family oxidoreductase [Fimbriimonadaceae bacterium]
MAARPLAVVTGASGGIGLALATELASRGYDLVLVARNQEGLDRAAADLNRSGAQVATIALDLSVPGAAKALVDQLGELDVDVLVNNAGFATYGPFAETDWDAESRMIEVNVIVLTELTKRLLPRMIARGRGRVLNVASTAAFMPGPLMAVYYASKAYVLSLGEALHEEVKGTGVTVTTLCPGPTKTGFQNRAGMQESKLVQSGLMDVTVVARIGVEGALAGKPVVIPGLKNKVQAVTPKLVPRKLIPGIVKNAQKKAH